MMLADRFTAPAHRRHRDQMEQALLDGCRIGVRLPQGIDGRYGRQNFAMLRPINPIGSQIFLHGRELFSPEAAQHYYRQGGRRDFSYDEFSEPAKEKIRRYLSPQGLNDRLFDYMEPRDWATYVAHEIARAKIRWPQIELPEFPPITRQNAKGQLSALYVALEGEGIDLARIDDVVYYPGPPEREQCLAERKAHAQKLLEQLSIAWGERVKESRLKTLTAKLDANGWDPEMVRNFHAGLKTNPSPNTTLDAILAAGIEARTEELLREAAGQMCDPYSQGFRQNEKEMAGMIVSSLQPRVLHLLVAQAAPVIASHSPRMSECADLLGYEPEDWAQVRGVFHGVGPMESSVCRPYIVVARANPPEILKGIIRHEAEHLRDVTRRRPFSSDSLVLEAAIAADTLRIKRLYADVQETARPPSDEVRKLAGLRGYRVDGPENLACMRTGLSEDLEEVARKCYCFMEGSDMNWYSTRHAQRFEAVAVMAELKHSMGTSFMREVLPNLYALFIRDRAGDERLRYDYSSLNKTDGISKGR